MSKEPTTTIIVEPIDPEKIGTELATVEKTSGISEDSAVALRDQFADFYNGIVEWREKAALVTKPDDPTHQKIAREVRLGMRRVRCDMENTRKSMKAESLARGKFIDGVAGILKLECDKVEEKMMAVEQYAERQEAARIAEIVRERTASLVGVEADPTAYNLAAMDDDTFRLVLDAARKRQAERIEAERRAEAERVAREQADRIAREKAEKEAAAARAEAERERKAREIAEDEAKKKQDEGERMLRRMTARADANLAAEREAREKAEREARAARQAEFDRIAREKAAEAARVKAEREAAEKA
ncbi:MAG TPA: hypothetical protein VM492_04070, partial [Sumerlaeia bacterium]|nr:hypothetical protein [Sumerlaeia bacterium]